MGTTPKKRIILVFLSLILLSCEDTITGYYQGTYKSTDEMHATGNAKMNFAQNSNGGHDITLEAVNWNLIQASNIYVGSKSSGLGYNNYEIKSTTPNINGMITVIGTASITYKEGPLTITFNLEK